MTTKELKRIILKSGNEELKDFVNKHFGIKVSTHELVNHLQTLKKLNEDTLIMGIARMDQIETDYDISKHYPILFSILGIVLGAGLTAGSKKIIIILTLIVALCLIYNMKQERKIRRVAVYFRSLLIQIRNSKK